MTKKELELENKFLKLQLKIISNLEKECCGSDIEKTFWNLGRIAHHSTNYQKELNYIKENGLPYNFFNEDTEI